MIAFIRSLEGEGEVYILYCNTNGCVYACTREIGLLLPDETCFHSQVMATTSYIPSVTDYKQYLICDKVS